MKTITRFVDALGTLFQATDIGTYFAPMFRPMITEQNRLHPIRVVPTSQDRMLQALLSGSRQERPSHL